MGLRHIAAIIDNDNYWNVTEKTFGHLAPKKNKSYKYKILFMKGEYKSGTPYLIQTKFENGLEDSPWLYETMNDLIFSFNDLTEGVYLIEGTFRNYRFYGNPKLIYQLK